MKVTIREIAKQAGVSPTSVSQVLNGKEIRITEEKKNKIYQVARELHYVSDGQAEEKQKKNRLIGLVVPDIVNPYFSQMAKVIITELEKTGRTVLITDSDNRMEQDISNLKELRKKRVEGIIFAPSGESAGEIEKLIYKIMEKDRIPLVLLDRDNAEYNCHSVMVDHFRGGYLATEHLISQGHRKIGCITGPMYLETAVQRFQGYKNACRDAGILEDEQVIACGDYQIRSGYENCPRLLESGVTAIFACNDMMAYGAYNYLKEQKIGVPEEISLIGFDDIFFSEIMGVELTTIRQPIEDIGTRAVQMLLEDRNEREKKRSVFQPYLVCRSTTKKR